jgi:hypothetical protein
MEVHLSRGDDINESFDGPRYRVCFWRHATDPKVRGVHAAWYELTGEVNVRSALAWAAENVGPFQTYSVYAVFDMPWPGKTARELNSRRVMVRLYGVDPTRNDEGKPRWPTEFYAREQWFGAHEGHEPEADAPETA